MSAADTASGRREISGIGWLVFACVNVLFFYSFLFFRPGCDSTCQFKPSSTSCGALTAAGKSSSYCQNGVCTPSICTGYTSLSFCGMKSDNPCRQQCLNSQTNTCSDGKNIQRTEKHHRPYEFMLTLLNCYDVFWQVIPPLISMLLMGQSTSDYCHSYVKYHVRLTDLFVLALLDHFCRSPLQCRL